MALPRELPSNGTTRDGSHPPLSISESRTHFRIWRKSRAVRHAALARRHIDITAVGAALCGSDDGHVDTGLDLRKQDVFWVDPSKTFGVGENPARLPSQHGNQVSLGTV